MHRRVALLAPIAGLAALGVGCAGRLATPTSREALIAQVTAAEIAFAKTMTDRDHAAFLSHVADAAPGGKVVDDGYDVCDCAAK